MTESRKFTTRDMALCALFAALVTVGAFIKIPVGPVPITLQTLFVLLGGTLLGKRNGAIACAVYLALGLMGVPVFTAGGGPGYVLKPSFGYIIGFVAGAWASGAVVGKEARPSFLRVLLADVLGLLVIYFIGTAYFWLLNKFYFGKTLGVWHTLVYCCFIFLPGDLASNLLGALLTVRLRPVLLRQKASA